MAETEPGRVITAERGTAARLVVYPPSRPPMAWAVLRGNLDMGRDATNGLKLEDARVSGFHARLSRRRDSGRFEFTDQGSTNGTFLEGVRVKGAVLESDAALRLGDSLILFEQVPAELQGAPADTSAAALAMSRQVAAAAATRAPLLLLGPTGAGKGRLAAQIARAASPARPFVHVNCAALPAELIESELFGYVRGAFTGAVADKRGLIEAAHGGTLFLDEIGELPPPLQTKLLTCLEQGRIRPVGATAAVKVDVRVIAATNVDLTDALSSGRFRRDLYYRLAALTLEVPPLRQRRADVLPLLCGALEIADHRSFTPEALEALLVHTWPGNVRELLNVGERLRSVSARPIDYHELPSEMTVFLRQRQEPRQVGQSRSAPPREHLVAELAAVGGNVSELARRLGKHRNQVVRWLEAHGLRRRDE